MPFKVKDLMINLTTATPDRAPCKGLASGIIPCGFTNGPITCFNQNSLFTCHVAESRLLEPCLFGGTLGPRGEDVQVDLQHYADLKTHLKAALAQVEAGEKAATESLLPKTVEEVELLESKLTEALDELRVRKVELKKKPGK